MKRSMDVRYVLIGLALFAAACGGRESMASKSAAAYRAAQATQKPAGSVTHEHAGHPMPADAPPVDHAAHGSMSAADHAAMGHGQHTAPMDHSQHAAPAGAPMDHSQHAAPAGAPMDHSQHDGQHAAMSSNAGAPAAPSAPLSSAEMRAVQPGATLRPDAFDAPAAASVSEAAKGRGQ